MDVHDEAEFDRLYAKTSRQAGVIEDLTIALHAAINAPKGVVPAEAEPFYNPARAQQEPAPSPAPQAPHKAGDVVWHTDMENCPNAVDIVVRMSDGTFKHHDAEDNDIQWSKHYPLPEGRKIGSWPVAWAVLV